MNELPVLQLCKFLCIGSLILVMFYSSRLAHVASLVVWLLTAWWEHVSGQIILSIFSGRFCVSLVVACVRSSMVKELACLAMNP